MRKKGALQRFQEGGYADPEDPDVEGYDEYGQTDMTLDGIDASGYDPAGGNSAGIDSPMAGGALSMADTIPYQVLEQKHASALAALQAARDRAMQSYKPEHDNRAAWMAAAAGLLSPTKTGSFGESAGYAAGNVAPYLQKQADADAAYKQTLAQSDLDISGKIYEQATKAPQIAEVFTPDGKRQKVMVIDGVPYPIGGQYAGANGANTSIEKYKWMAEHINDPKLGPIIRAQLNHGNPNIQVTIDQKEALKKIGTGLGDVFNNSQAAAHDAYTNIGRMNRLTTMLQQAGSGKWTGDIAEAQKAMKFFGLEPEQFNWKDITGVADASAALANQMALSLRNPMGGEGMPGSLSDSDRKFLESMVPNIGTSKDALPLMTDFYNRLQQRRIEEGKIVRQYLKDHDDIDVGVYDVLDEYANSHPIFTDKDAEAITSIGNPPRPSTVGTPSSGSDGGGTWISGDN